MSQGEFSLIFLRCNYASLQAKITKKLRQFSPVEMREIYLHNSVKTLYTSILKELGNEQPKVLIIGGLESIKKIDSLLTSTNYVREEFRKNFSFPVVIWINDIILEKIIRLATDLENWASIIEFILPTDELVKFIKEKTDEVFADTTNLNQQICSELATAWKDLQNRREELNTEIKSSLEFILGWQNYSQNQLESALSYYQSSLAYWQEVGNLERQVILLLYIALLYYHQAEKNQIESVFYWQESKNYFDQLINILEQAQRQDLIIQYISKLGEVLRNLKAWDELENLAYKSCKLHQNYGTQLQLAQDYGFLAEVQLEKEHYDEAMHLAQKALQILEYTPDVQPSEYSLYRFILARSQRGLGNFQESIKNLEIVKKESSPQYNPSLYIAILEMLRSLYYEQGEYLAAFHIKQEQMRVEHQYGLRAFIGAAYLHPQQYNINPLLLINEPEEVAYEISVSGRQQDVKKLIQRLATTENKLIIIHGQSGVGKSSILTGGLIPTLKQEAIGERDALPIMVRVYTDWMGLLGRCLQEQFQQVRGYEININLDCLEAIIEQLRKNSDLNLLTVLLFDQFEEFFFVCKDQAKRRQFYEFLRLCLDIPFVKVILSLREDYLHYLLECDRMVNLTVTNNNILDKKIRYYLGNFSPEDTKAIVQSLTERTQFNLEPALIDKLVEDLAGDLGEVRPIELQIVGSQLQSDKITTLKKYQQFGTKEKLVERFLEATVYDCGLPNERAAKLVLYLLTDETGTRPLKTRADLITDLAAEGGKIDLVLEIFVKSGLVLLLPHIPADFYQLVHDYLVSFIRQKQGHELLTELRQEQKKRIIAESAKTKAENIQLYLIDTLSGYANELMIQGRELDALVASLRAGIPLQQLEKVTINPNDKTSLKIQESLQEILDWIKEFNRLEGHNNNITSLSFSPDNKILASASGDKTVKIWDVATGKELHTLRGHEKWVYSVNFSPNNQILASGSDDHTIKLWDAYNGQELCTLTGHTEMIYGLNFSPDGKILASASIDKTIKIWDVSTGQNIHTLKGHKNWVLSVCFSKNGKILASSCIDGVIKLWDVVTFQEIRTLKGHNNTVWSVKFSPDDQILASGSSDTTIKTWDVATGEEKNSFKGHDHWVYTISFTPDGETLVSGSFDQTIKLWNVKTAREIRTLKGHSDLIYSTDISSDGQVLASGSNDNTIKFWHLTKKQKITILNGHNDSVRSVNFSPDGKTLVSGSYDQTIKIWDVATGAEKLTLSKHHGWVLSTVFNRDGDILASGSADNTIKIWDVATWKEICTLTGHITTIRTISFTPDGKTLASGSVDNTIKIWDVVNAREIFTLKGHKDWVLCVSFSPDGKILASCSTDKMIKLWDVATGEEIRTLKGHNDMIRSVSFNHNGQTLASGSYDQTIKIWDVATGEEISTFSGHKNSVNSVSFSSISFNPDGKSLASGSADHSIKIWDITTGKEIRTLKGHKHPIWYVTFSPDGEILASASGDKTIILWKNWREPNLPLDDLLVDGCNWVRDYLNNNPNVSESDRSMCQQLLNQYNQYNQYNN
ncbi:MAG TPA: hypothetical protein VK184_11325 [Nostocaceae cyanobacterium]|nr:hypothetical protein [Nostocaceae cyanobacterium]